MALDVVSNLENKGYARAACNRVLILIRYAFNQAIKWRVLQKNFDNPTEGIPFYAQNRCQRFLSDKELEAVNRYIRRQQPDRSSDNPVASTDRCETQ